MPSTPILDMRIFGVQVVQEELRRGARAASDMSPVLNDVADDLMRVIGINFSSEGRRGGGSWAWLDPAWVKRKVSLGMSPDILVAWGALRDSMTSRGDLNQNLDVTDNNITLSSNLSYAEYPVTGTSRMPKRDYAQFISSDVSRWTKMCEDYLYDAMGGLV